jgi:hypothetical protein
MKIMDKKFVKGFTSWINQNRKKGEQWINPDLIGELLKREVNPKEWYNKERIV